ncbi:MAG: type II secretion system protein [Candidatus Buchananbacteria bacterium]|nr:type II secretion system protein [Candidatus Buchananbacteria bacterium]
MAQFSKNHGFTLLELLIVIGILSILTSSSILVLNPAKLFKNAKDVKRNTDTENLLKAIKFYEAQQSKAVTGLDGTLKMLGSATAGCNIACRAPDGSEEYTADSCLNLADELAEYLPVIPYDPEYGNAGKTNYVVRKNVTGEIIVRACSADENGNPPSVVQLPAPTSLKVGFGIASGVSNWVKTAESLSFNFDVNSLSNVSAFRLYQKKPQDSAFNMVAEFSNPPSSTPCNINRTYGTWVLGSLSPSCPGSAWHISRTSSQPVSSYVIGDYLYYVTALDSSGTEGLASRTSTSTFLGTFPIQTPIVVESPGSLNPTFRWQAASSWSQALGYWVIVAPSDGSGQQRMLIPITSSGPAVSKVYDGPALDLNREYTIWIYGRSHNSDQTEDRASFASETATFRVSE